MSKSVKAVFVKGVVQKPRAKKENPRTVEEAIAVSTPFVYSMAKKWTRNHHSLYQDFVQEGFVGVLEAWKRFNGSKHQSSGYRFSSYSWLWIRAMMKDFADRQWKSMNNTISETSFADGSLFDMSGESYEISTDLMDIKAAFNNLSEEDQRLIQLKAEGYTYEEAAEELNFATLHQARNQHIALLKELSQ